MDFLSPVVGKVTGIEMAQWKDILIFGLKVFIFSVPFVIIGLLVEKDVIRVPVVSKIVKSTVILVLTLPIIFFGILNYMAPGLSDSFWERYPVFEGLWIMEGGLAPAILSGMALLYLVLYVLETARGDLSN